MMTPDELRSAIKSSRLPVSRIAKLAGIAPTTLYSFASGASECLRAPAHAAVEQALTEKSGGVSEERELFAHPNGLLEEAAAFGLDTDAIARKAIERAVKAERIRRWNEQNRDAVQSWNELVEREGRWSDGIRAF